MKRLIIILLSIFYSFHGKTQDNLIPNSGFELGDTSALNSGCNFNSNTSFELNLQDWMVAEHNNNNGVGEPDWINYYSCVSRYEQNLCVNGDHIAQLPSKRFLFLQKVIDTTGILNKTYHNAVVTKLKTPLEAGVNYTLRIKYSTTDKNYVDTNPIPWHLRVFFTEKGNDSWEDGNDNQMFEANFANIALGISQLNHCFYNITNRNFTVPNDKWKTEFIVLYAEEGAFLIDEIELFKTCESPYLIENKLYDDLYYTPSRLESGNFIVENSHQHLFAGRDVGNDSPNGDVVIEPNAHVIFTAEDVITISDGFKALKGAEFIAAIDECGSGGLYMDSQISEHSTYSNDFITNDLPTNTSINMIDAFRPPTVKCAIYPNPSNGQFNIKFDLRKAPTRISVFNSLGQTVIENELINNNDYLLDLTDQPTGFYELLIIDGNAHHTETLILN